MKRTFAALWAGALVYGFSALVLAQQPAATSTQQKTVKIEQKATPAKPKVEILKLNKEEITALQNALSKAGYYKGKANGVFNPETKLALRKYQRANKLQITSAPTAETLNKLGVTYTAHSAKAAEPPLEHPKAEAAAQKPDTTKQN